MLHTPLIVFLCLAFGILLSVCAVQDWRTLMQNSEPLSLWSFLLFGTLPSKHQLPRASWTPVCFGFPLQSHTLCSCSKSTSKWKTWWESEGSSSLALFFLWDHYPSLPIIKCLKKFVSDILSVFLVTYNRRTSPVPNTLTGGSGSSRYFHVCHLMQLSQALPGTQNWLLYINVPKFRWLGSMREVEQILMLRLTTCSEKALMWN